MNDIKKTARKLQLSGGGVQGLRREPSKMIISNSRKNASPNLDGEGGFFPMYLGFILAVIGAACVTSGLMRAIDWLESH